MKKYYKSTLQVIRQIKSDWMLFAACIIPFFLGITIKVVVPIINSNTIKNGDVGALVEYYPIFDLFLSIIAPVMLCFAFAMVTLEEMDDKVSRYFFVTPLGKRGYLFSRLVVPACLALLISIVVLLLFSISEIARSYLVGLAVLGAMQAIIVSLMIVSFSSNKLEGMAVTKLGAIFLLGIPAPFFIKGASQYLISVLPSFWMAKALESNLPISILVGIAISIVWILLLEKKFIIKVST